MKPFSLRFLSGENSFSLRALIGFLSDISLITAGSYMSSSSSISFSILDKDNLCSSLSWFSSKSRRCFF